MNAKKTVTASLVIYLTLIFILSSFSTVPNVKGPLGIDKIAHFIEFGILGFILVHFFRLYLPYRKRIIYIILAVLGASFYGGLDEFHQYFIPGRDCSPLDFSADLIGSLFGAFFVFIHKMKCKKAVIDIGSNSILLLIAEKLNRGWLPLMEKMEEPQLGKNIDRTGQIGNEELEKALKIEAKIIGINNRNLKTLKVDLNTCLCLKERVPEEKILVAESGVKTREDILLLEKAGFQAVLIGSALMQAEDIGKKLKEFLGR